MRWQQWLRWPVHGSSGAHGSCTDHRSVGGQVLAGLVLAGLVPTAARDQWPTSGIRAGGGICEICGGNQGSEYLYFET